MIVIAIVRKDQIQILLARLAARSVALDSELLATVSAIIEDVRRRGDEAVIEYTRRFDGVEVSEFRVEEDALRRAAATVEPRIVDALRVAIGNVRRFH